MTDVEFERVHAAGTSTDAPTRPAPITPVGPVDRRRLVIGSLGFVVVAALFVVAVRALAGQPGHAALAFLAGMVLIPVVAAPLEWCVHRFVYHEAVVRRLRAIFVVHTAHHYAFFPTSRYVTGGPARRLAIRTNRPDVHRSPVGNARVRLAHFGWYVGIGVVAVWLPAWLLTGDVWFLAGLIAASAVVSNLFIVVHDTIHRPGSHRLVEAQPWFPFLDRHHYVHHVDLGANLNFLLPLGDAVFGTLRRELTDAELAAHGPLSAAKARRSGEGERVAASMR